MIVQCRSRYSQIIVTIESYVLLDLNLLSVSVLD
jgi:hypothetical protein